jgi:hypothetical protein
MGNHGKNYSVQEQLIAEQTERIMDGLKRINKSITALHRAVSAQAVVDRLATLAGQPQLNTAITKDKDGWE